MTGPMLGGRYVLGELLGRGGMAEVYRAHDEVLGRDVAVKLFRVGDLDAHDQRRAGEIRLLAGLSHPGLVTVFDAGQDGDTTYLVMELVSGTTLRQRLDAGPLTPEETARLGAELSGALAYVHSCGIVHRDVKPANILLAEDRTAKLTDFGVAKLLDGTSITTTGTTLGTPNYLSPEQATGAPLSGASDVYSLGLVLLECLTGTVAFPGHGIEAAVARLHNAPPIPASVGPDWAALLRGMTARDPAGRPEAGAVSAALGGSGGSAGEPTAPTRVLVTPPPTPQRRWGGWLPAAIAATVVGIAAIAAVAAISAGSSGSPASTDTSTRPVVTTATSTPHTSASSSASTSASTRASSSSSIPAPPPPPKKPEPKPKPKPKPKPPGHRPGKGHDKKDH